MAVTAISCVAVMPMQDIGHVLGTNKGKFQQSSEKEAYQYGNEEEGHQKGSQEEKEVTEPGEAFGLAIFLFNEKGLRNVVSRRPFSFV